MTEIQLQQLLQRTSSSNQDEEGMDMTVKDGIKMSKYDIRVVRIGSKVSPQMKTDVYNFNKKYVGKDSVFPDENGAPRILEQFKDNPYSLELRDEFTTGNKPKKLPTNWCNILPWETRYAEGSRAFCENNPSGGKMQRSPLLLALGHSTKARTRRTKKRTAFTVSRWMH
jgi:hypothetical protein